MKFLECVKYGVISCTAVILFASPAVAQNLPTDQYCDPVTVQYGDCDDTEVIVVPPGNPPQNDPPGFPGFPGDVSEAGDLIDPGDIIPGDIQVSPDTGAQVVGSSTPESDPTASPDSDGGETTAASSSDDSGATSPYPVLPDTGGERWVIILAGGAMVAAALLLRRFARV